MYLPRSLLLSLGLLSACTPTLSDTEDGSSDGEAITAGQIVAGDSPYYWANLTFPQYMATSTAAGNPPMNAEAFLPETDPLRARLQTWADRLETAMRKVTGNTAAPHPVVELLSTSTTYNAWSSATWARLGAPIGNTKDALLPEKQSFYFYGGPTGVTIGLVESEGGLSGYTHPAEWNRPASFTSVWDRNVLTQPTCKLSVSGGRVLTPGCNLGAQADDAIVLATSPFLTVATDLSSLVSDERALVFVMAHELGHMFRAHTSPLTVRKYDFWTERSGSKGKLKPAEADDYAATYRTLVRTPIALDTVVGSKHPRQLRLLVLLAAYYTEAVRAALPTFLGGGLGNCSGIDEWFREHGKAGDFLANVLRTQEATAEVQAAYMELERIVDGCNAPLRFTRNETAADGIDANWVEAVIAQQNANLLLPEPPAIGESLVAYFARAEATATTALAKEAAFRALLAENEVGLYTIEQEADEVALELMVRVGFSRNEVLDAWVAFTAAMDKKFPQQAGADTGRASAAQCAAWMKDGFLITTPDGTRKPIEMTLGDINEVHHGDCYRLYNLWRESNAHVYKPGKRQPELQPAWSELQQHAIELTAAAAAAGR